LLSPLTTHAHCTFLSPPSLSHLSKKGTSIAHCPLSNAYFSSLPFPLREALDLGVKVGLGTDVAGGYSVDIMNAMRQAVAVSRMRQGALIESSLGEEVKKKAVDVDWKEAIYIATRGGANALGLSSGVFKIGAPFDAQLSEY
jgi:guanine deaminase